MGLSEAALAQISQVVEQEIQKQVFKKINKFVEYIARRHDISLKLILEDLNNIDSLEIPGPILKDNQCVGIRTNGNRCKMRRWKGGSGYCRWHMDQKQQVIPVRSPSTTRLAVEHTHSLPPLYLAGCPACDRVGTKLLIDM
jgi:hypothetical protein